MTKNRFPAGWDQERVERVLEHYESQSEEEAVAEDERAAAFLRPSEDESALDFTVRVFEAIHGRPPTEAEVAEIRAELDTVDDGG